MCAGSAHARDLPTYRMDHHFFFSDTVVYCEEEDIHREKQSGQDVDVVKCRVQQVFKGDLAPGAELEVTYDWNHPRKLLLVREHHSALPGKALLFLHKTPDGKYKLDDARLVQEGKVYRFLQIMNPGGLELVPENRPENIVLPAGAAYDEKELLEDAAAVAKTLTVTEKNGLKSEISTTLQGALVRIRLTNARKQNPKFQSEGMADWYGTDSLVELGIEVKDSKGMPPEMTEEGKTRLDEARTRQYPYRGSLKAGESHEWVFALDEIYKFAPGKYTLSSTVSFVSDGGFKLSSGAIGFERTESGSQDVVKMREMIHARLGLMSFDGLDP